MPTFSPPSSLYGEARLLGVRHNSPQIQIASPASRPRQPHDPSDSGATATTSPASNPHRPHDPNLASRYVQEHRDHQTPDHPCSPLDQQWDQGGISTCISQRLHWQYKLFNKKFK